MSATTTPTTRTAPRRARGRTAMLSAAAVLVTMAGGTGASAATLGASAHLSAAGTSRPGLANPATSVQPTYNFRKYCYTPGYSAQCNKAAIKSIDIGRHAEGMGGIAIPKAYYALTTVQQLSFLANKERRVRGLAPMPQNRTLDGAAESGAERGDDPSGPANYAWGSNIAWDYQTPLAADFGWMYDDGTDSPNSACTTAGAAGCWGHRDNILAHWSGAQGAGVYDNKGDLQLTQLFVAGY